jgi:hypothetical protein
VNDRVPHGPRERCCGIAMRGEQCRVIGPERLDRKVRSPKAAGRAEEAHRLAPEPADQRGIDPMHEGPEARKRHDDVRPHRKRRHRLPPGGEPRRLPLAEGAGHQPLHRRRLRPGRRRLPRLGHEVDAAGIEDARVLLALGEGRRGKQAAEEHGIEDRLERLRPLRPRPEHRPRCRKSGRPQRRRSAACSSRVRLEVRMTTGGSAARTVPRSGMEIAKSDRNSRRKAPNSGSARSITSVRRARVRGDCSARRRGRAIR